MAISAIGGSKFYIGPVVTDATDTAAEYAALTWTEVEEWSSAPDIGDTTNMISVPTIGRNRALQLKGTVDGGSRDFGFVWDGLATGQAALKAAGLTDYTYGFKIVADDKADANDTNSIFYFQAKVSASRRTGSGPNDAAMLMVTLAVTSPTIEVPTTVVA